MEAAENPDVRGKKIIQWEPQVVEAFLQAHSLSPVYEVFLISVLMAAVCDVQANWYFRTQLGHLLPFSKKPLLSQENNSWSIHTPLQDTKAKNINGQGYDGKANRL